MLTFFRLGRCAYCRRVRPLSKLAPSFAFPGQFHCISWENCDRKSAYYVL